MGDSASKEDGNERSTCDIRGCINESFNHGYCGDCLNEMQHYALDLAGVP